jgi:hypothetical protein
MFTKRGPIAERAPVGDPEPCMRTSDFCVQCHWLPWCEHPQALVAKDGAKENQSARGDEIVGERP